MNQYTTEDIEHLKLILKRRNELADKAQQEYLENKAAYALAQQSKELLDLGNLEL